MRKLITLVSTHHSCSQGQWRETSSHWLPYTKLNHMEIYLAHAKSRGYFLPIKWSKVFLNIGSASRIPPYFLRWIFNTQNNIHLTIWEIWIHQGTFWTLGSTSMFPRTGVLKDFYYTMTYLDNIIIFSRTAEEHFNPIKQVFKKKFWNVHLLMKLSKCHIFTKEIQYLRHILSTTGIRPLPSKTQAINNMHPPKTAKQVHAFLGLIG